MFRGREVLGFSLLAEAFGVKTDKEVMDIYENLKKHFNVVKECEYKFTPYGLTIVAVLTESHIALHSYPELNVLSIDIYSCNENAREVFVEILKELQTAYKVKYFLTERKILASS